MAFVASSPKPRANSAAPARTVSGQVDAAEVLAALAELPETLREMQATLRKISGEPPDWEGQLDAGEAREGDFNALTPADVAMQQAIFNQFDTDGNGRLAQNEVKRMLKAMKLFDSTDELIKVIQEMDDDNSGTIEFDEYLSYVDEKCAGDPGFLREYRRRSVATKLGYDGTSWRQHANVSWLTNQGVMIMTCFLVVNALTQFRFVLVPLVMAYFLTFLLGPIQDILIQRPLLCSSLVCCDKPCVRPALNQNPECCGKTMRWEEEDLEGGGRRYQTPRDRLAAGGLGDLEEGQWDERTGRLNWDAEGACCHATPTLAFSEGAKYHLWAFFTMCKIPEAVSVLGAIVLAVVVVSATTIVIGNEVHEVTSDVAFRERLTKAVHDVNVALEAEHQVQITQLVDLERYTLNDTASALSVYTLDDISAASGPFVSFVNDLLLTVLLCLYMLLTRVPAVEEEQYKDVQRLSLFEKIKAKVNYYVVLKTALSALTGGLVGLTLLVCGVRLASVFGLLTFLLNYIPNVGSMIAMLLPIPVIYVDDELSPATAWAAVLIPALIQSYVGNILEPTVFGEALNVTALSVLAALVFWGSLWGLQGAVLSVPLLAAMKIALEEADYPLAKMLLRIIRESAAIDDAVEAQKKPQLLKRKRPQLPRTPTTRGIVNPMAESRAADMDRADD